MEATRGHDEARPAGPVTLDSRLATAIYQIEAGRIAEAHDSLRSLYEVEPSNAQVRSYYGLSKALEEKRFDDSVELCRSAIKQEFFNPCLYHNMARVHLAFGFKGEAIRFLRRGLLIDPSNGQIARELEVLGRRDRQILRFLPRKHPLNRLLGRIRSSFGRSPRVPAAA